MGQDDTPPEPMPARSHGAPSLYDLLEGLAREMRSNFKEMRTENANANRDTQARLSGIEGRIGEGAAAISKHDMQLASVIEECAEHHVRIEKLERDGGSGLVRRVDALEAADEARAKAEGAAMAVAEAAAAAPTRKLLASLMDGGARSLGPIVVGFLTWLVLTYARGLPGPVSAPASRDIQPDKGTSR